MPSDESWSAKHKLDKTRPDIPPLPQSGQPWFAQESYPPLPPPPSPQLPDFKPKGMSTLDKVFAWMIIFVIVIFGMIVASHWLLRPLPPNTFTVICSTSKHLPKGSLLCR